jgi:hypothetical protein
MSTTARRERPTSRWISCVRPDAFPRVLSRWVLSFVARGVIAYSAVTHPCPLLSLTKGGTFSSTLAVQMTCVSPALISAEPSACLLTPVVMVTGRI